MKKIINTDLENRTLVKKIQEVCPTEFLMEYKKMDYDKIVELSEKDETDIMIELVNNMEKEDLLFFLKEYCIM